MIRVEVRESTWCKFLLSVGVVGVSAIGEVLRWRAHALMVCVRVEGLRATCEELLAVERKGCLQRLDRISVMRLPWLIEGPWIVDGVQRRILKVLRTGSHVDSRVHTGDVICVDGIYGHPSVGKRWLHDRVGWKRHMSTDYW